MANELQTVDQQTGEVITFTDTAQPLAVQLAQVELNQAVTTARAFPRSITTAVRNIMSLATLDEESAKECVYALPRGGKPIKGPSIRFAEIVASQWGNCHTGSRIVAVDRFEKVVIAEGVFFDLETGMKRTAQIRRKISGRDGRIFNDDMITVTGNAAASIAMREAILKGIPKAVWRTAYERCEGVIAGDIKTLSVRRDDAIKAFAVWGIKPEQIFSALEVGGLDDIGLDELGTLIAMHKAIKAGEQKVEDYFPAKADAGQAVDAAKGTAAKLGKIAETAQTRTATENQPDGTSADEAGPDETASTSEEGTAGADDGSAASSDAGETFPGDTPAASGEPDFAAMIERFKANAPQAETIEELENAADELLPHMNGEALSRNQREVVQGIWEDNRKRIAERVRAPKGAAKKASQVNTDDPDFKKGWADAERGATKCLKQEIRDNPDRLAMWKAGFEAFHAQAAAEG